MNFHGIRKGVCRADRCIYQTTFNPTDLRNFNVGIRRELRLRNIF